MQLGLLPLLGSAALLAGCGTAPVGQAASGSDTLETSARTAEPLAPNHEPADAVVLRATGPSADQFPPGTRFAADAEIGLQRGDRISLLANGVTRSLIGPGVFAVTASGEERNGRTRQAGPMATAGRVVEAAANGEQNNRAATAKMPGPNQRDNGPLGGAQSAQADVRAPAAAEPQATAAPVPAAAAEAPVPADHRRPEP